MIAKKNGFFFHLLALSIVISCSANELNGKRKIEWEIERYGESKSEREKTRIKQNI